MVRSELDGCGQYGHPHTSLKAAFANSARLRDPTSLSPEALWVLNQKPVVSWSQTLFFLFLGGGGKKRVWYTYIGRVVSADSASLDNWGCEVLELWPRCWFS